MNSNPNVKRILCFGDSLTYGADPNTEGRLDINSRWTGVLQNLLGGEYDIIEEGLSGRTTDLDDEKEFTRNGFEYFKPCFVSTMPVSIIVLLLGTNDLKSKFGRSVPEIANALEKYIEYINTTSDKEGWEKPKIVLMSPPLIDENYLPADWELEGGEERSQSFSENYKSLAEKTSSLFLDLRDVKPSKIDGVHLDEKGNIEVAEKLYELISKI